MDLAFHTLDVFTDRVFGGNPLAVYPDGSGLDLATMQRIAREMNLSETVFLLPPETSAGACRVRIFTPARELPFAGHPTIGSAWFLAATGAAPLPRDGVGLLVLEENVGPIAVEVTMRRGQPEFARFTTAVAPEYRAAPDRAACARLLSLSVDDIGAPGWEPELVSCGLPYLVVPVRDVDALARSRLDMAAWDELLKGAWTRSLYPITPRPRASGYDVRVRMYAPASGVPEDPATGSAAASLAAYLGKRAGADDGGAAGTLSWRIEQGVEMGRPSRIDVEADVRAGAVAAVRVGGRAVPVSRGTLTLAADA